MAEKHGKANLVVDSAKTTLDYGDENSYCICCNMPYIEQDNKYSLCCENTDMGELGPGFPLFLIFVKYLCYLMLLLTVVFYAPT